MMESNVSLRDLMAVDILPCIAEDDMAFFLGFALRLLEQHAEGMPRARVFAHAVSAVATAEQWLRWHPVIKRSLSTALYNQVQEEAGW
jgi:hypothetical protein